MSLRIEFVERATKPGAKVAVLCREFGISRETGHKWLRRYREGGHEGLEEQSRRPTKSPRAATEDVILAVLEAREAHPSWGPKKLVELLKRRLRDATPSRATIARILVRFGKVRERRRRRGVSVVDSKPRVLAAEPNDVWTIDFKGWWRAKDGTRCEPLTVRDAHSRYVLLAEVMPAPSMDEVYEKLERLFRKHGVPKKIQCDNGAPFIAVHARAGLTRLSARWVSLGIDVVRSRPGCPQDNGAHERMHRDMSEEVEARPAESSAYVQRLVDRWRQQFNHVRPHEALGGRVPAEVYKPALKRPVRERAFVYPVGWLARRAYGDRGTISVNGCKRRVGRAFVGLNLGVEPLSEQTHRLWLGPVDLGEIAMPPSIAELDSACSRFIERPMAKKRRAA